MYELYVTMRDDNYESNFVTDPTLNKIKNKTADGAGGKEGCARRLARARERLSWKLY